MAEKTPTQTDNAPRDCGGCNVCCTAMKVSPLNKPAGTPCPHQSEAGCGIYGQRPDVCRVWFCMWVRDDGRIFDDVDHRPDRLGVFFTASPPDPNTSEQTVFAHEVRPHASDEPQARSVIEFLRQAAPVAVVPYSPPPDSTTDLTINGRSAA
jgi:Fe-S-cluster containining protein